MLSLVARVIQVMDDHRGKRHEAPRLKGAVGGSHAGECTEAVQGEPGRGNTEGAASTSKCYHTIVQYK